MHKHMGCRLPHEGRREQTGTRKVAEQHHYPVAQTQAYDTGRWQAYSHVMPGSRKLESMRRVNVTCTKGIGGHNRCRVFVLSTAAKTSGNVVASGQPEIDMRTLWQNSACLQNLGSWPTVAQAVVNASGQNSPNNEADFEVQITTLSKQ